MRGKDTDRGVSQSPVSTSQTMHTPSSVTQARRLEVATAKGSLVCIVTT